VSVVVVTDDIHHLRCRYILEAYDAAHVDAAAEYLRRMEQRV
jgi:hypothetical protein